MILALRKVLQWEVVLRMKLEVEEGVGWGGVRQKQVEMAIGMVLGVVLGMALGMTGALLDGVPDVIGNGSGTGALPDGVPRWR